MLSGTLATVFFLTLALLIIRWIVLTAWEVIRDTAVLIRPFVESFIGEEVPEWILNLGGVAFIFLIGFIVTLVVRQYYRRIPLLGIFVDGVKGLTGILFPKNEEKQAGKKGDIVLVEYPHGRGWELGMVTQIHMEHDIRMLGVYIAKTPTVWTGDFASYPEENVIYTGISKPEWMSMVTTGGTFGEGPELKKALKEVRRRMNKLEGEWRVVIEKVKEALRKGEIRLPKGGGLGF